MQGNELQAVDSASRGSFRRAGARGWTDRTTALVAGGENWPKTPERCATTEESTTSAHSTLSLHGDNRSARGGGIGARAGGGGGDGAKTRRPDVT